MKSMPDQQTPELETHQTKDTSGTGVRCVGAHRRERSLQERQPSLHWSFPDAKVGEAIRRQSDSRALYQ
jgi:hypothetical protein